MEPPFSLRNSKTAPESVKDYAASPAALQQLLDLTCHGFYVVTEEDGTTIFTPQF